jgi:hypothetical protein
MVLRNFRAVDFENHRKEQAGETVEPAAAAAQPARPESNEVPTGTTVEILNWVGDDRDRARRALDAENENKAPRKTLVPQLEALLRKDENENENEETE